MVGGGAYDSSMYCKCLGSVSTDIFVKCDGDAECPNGGWMHPSCTDDLKNRTQEELNEMDEWYCEECVGRINNEQNEDDDAIKREQELKPEDSLMQNEEQREKIETSGNAYIEMHEEQSQVENKELEEKISE
ncbi:MAG: hypothetical protein ACMG6E_06150 [Candidatus Roizmanbacteria bacterium]